MLYVGQKNKLKVLRITSVGFFLGDDENNDVLLPNKYIASGAKVDDVIEVFIYRDSEDRVIATNLEPYVQLNEFGFLKVVGTNQYGAFMDWGLEKDLFVPFKEQRIKMEEGRSYVVYLYLDKNSDRIVASNKLNKFLDKEALNVEVGDEVDLLIGEHSDLGFNVIINNAYKGLLYENEIFQDIRVGDKVKGYIKNIREDQKIDVSLQKQGFQNLEINAQYIFDYLKENSGFLNLTDNSTPEEITKVLHMSKKTFKKSIGLLYKQRLVRLENDGVYLV